MPSPTPDLQRIVEALKACRERYEIRTDFDAYDWWVFDRQEGHRIVTGSLERCQEVFDFRCAEAMVRAIVPAELVALSERAVPHWSFRDDAERSGAILAPSTNPAIGGDDVVLSCAYSDRMHEDDRANIKLAFEAVQWLRSLSAIFGETQP